ncbi:MAG TPA: lysylphosphatidylglycerol synthase transmembrane domain-containing protein [Gemmatimonadales bacterium]|nr:lysylphosphatidylglycerol synthase transmembrane domain-containing protein [Gemmatimonadales bacterium]
MRRHQVFMVTALVWGGCAIVLVAHWDQSREIWHSLTRVPLWSLAVAFLLVLGQWGFQSLRLWAILPRGVAASLARTAYAFAIGEWVNIFIPARGGDALKVVLLNRAAGVRPMTLPTAAGAVLADKIVDGGTLFLLCAAIGLSGLLRGGIAARLEHPVVVLAAVAGGALLVAVVLECTRGFERVTPLRNDLVKGLSSLADSSKTLVSLSFSLGAWLAEVLAIRVLCAALGYSLSPPQIVLSLLTLNLGISVPISVANLGVYETVLAFALSQSGVPLPAAVALATLHHGLELLATNAGAATVSLCRTLSRER